MKRKYLIAYILSHFFFIPIFCQNYSDSENCCIVHVAKENVFPATLKNSVTLEKLIQSRFNDDLKLVNSFQISIQINKKGQPSKIDFWREGEKTDSFDILSNKVKNYILKYCKWNPAYIFQKGKRYYIAVHDDYIIK